MSTVTADDERSHRVLIIDDSAPTRALVEAMAEELGAVMAEASDGRTGIEMVASTGPYDLVLVDFEMPGLDGEATVRGIRTIEAEAGLGRHRVLGLSADASGWAAERFAAAGADGHLHKPLSLADLEAQLSRAPEPKASVAAQTGPAAALDWGAALARTGLPAPIMLEIAGTFRSEASGKLADGDAAAAAGDIRTLGRLAHTIRGSASVFAAQPTVKAALAVGVAARGDDTAAAVAAWAELADEVRALLDALERVRDSSDAPPGGGGT